MERLGGNMSVSLLEVLENAGYDIKNNVEDAKWLMSQSNEWEELHETAQDLVDEYEDYEDFIYEQEESGNFDNPSFEEWRDEH